jgi:hypothetical protein
MGMQIHLPYWVYMLRHSWVVILKVDHQPLLGVVCTRGYFGREKRVVSGAVASSERREKYQLFYARGTDVMAWKTGARLGR